MRSEDALRIILRPYVTEKTFDLIEKENKLVFIVDRKVGKEAIKQAIQMLYDVDVKSVNTVSTIAGRKAYVRFVKDRSAGDLASRLGLV